MDLERLKPLGARFFVRPDPPEVMSRGGIWYPDSARKPVGIGTVVAMGPGMLCSDGSRWPMPDVRPGSRVIFGARHPFPKTKIDGEELLIIRDDMILGELLE